MSQAPDPSYFVLLCEKAIEAMTEEERKQGKAIRFASGITIVAYPDSFEFDWDPGRVLRYAMSLQEKKE